MRLRKSQEASESHKVRVPESRTSFGKVKGINHSVELPLMGGQTGYGEVPYFRMAYYGAQLAVCGHGIEISGPQKAGSFLST